MNNPMNNQMGMIGEHMKIPFKLLKLIKFIQFS